MQHLNEFTFSHIQGKHCLSIMPRFKNELSSAQNLVKQWNWLLWKSCLGQLQGLQSISNKRGAWFCKTGEMYWRSLLYEDLIEKKETDKARLKQPGSLRCLMDTGLMKQKRLWPGKRVSLSSPPPPPFSSLKLFFGLFPVLAPLLDRLHFHIHLSLFLSLFFFLCHHAVGVSVGSAASCLLSPRTPGSDRRNDYIACSTQASHIFCLTTRAPYCWPQ